MLQSVRHSGGTVLLDCSLNYTLALETNVILAKHLQAIKVGLNTFQKNSVPGQLGTGQLGQSII